MVDRKQPKGRDMKKHLDAKMLNALEIMMALNPASDDFKEVVAAMLGRLDPAKPIGTRLRDAIMRLSPGPFFTAALFRERVGATEIYLRQGAIDDIDYPGQWHVPGSFYRHGELDHDVEVRLARDFGAAKFEKSNLVGHQVLPESRGTIHAMIFLVELKGDPRIDSRHDWFRTDRLPDGMADLHRSVIIPNATRHRHFPHVVVG